MTTTDNLLALFMTRHEILDQLYQAVLLLELLVGAEITGGWSCRYDSGVHAGPFQHRAPTQPNTGAIPLALNFDPPTAPSSFWIVGPASGSWVSISCPPPPNPSGSTCSSDILIG